MKTLKKYKKLLNLSRKVSDELYDNLIATAQIKFQFEQKARDDKIRDNNSVNLWFIEYWVSKSSELDHQFRIDAIQFIIDSWQERLSSIQAVQKSGWQIYIYEMMAPKIDVARSDFFIYPNPSCHKLTFKLEDFLEIWKDRDWFENFRELSEEEELEAEIEQKRIDLLDPLEKREYAPAFFILI